MQEAINTYIKFVPFQEFNLWDVKNYNSIIHNFKFPLIELKEILSIDNMEWVEIEDEKEYPILGVRAQGKGVFINRVAKGSELTMKKYQKSKANYLFYCKVRTVNGQWGIVYPEFENSFGSSNMQYLKVDMSKIDLKYLEMLLSVKRLTNSFDKNAIGADGRHFTLNTLLSLKIPLPSLAEQQKIVDAYTTKIQQAQTLQAQANHLEEEIEKYLFDALGYQKNTEKGKSKFGKLLQLISYSLLDKWGVDQNNNSNKLTLTKSFEIKYINQICSVSSGGTPSRARKEYYGGKIPWIKTGEVINDVIYDTEEKITQEAINNSSAKIYPKGSLIIAMYGQGLTRGRTAKLGIDASTNQACAVLYNIDNSIVLTDFLWIYLMGEYHRLREMASGNNQPNLNAQMIKDYPVIIPPIETQKEIINEINTLKSNILNNKSELSNIMIEAEQKFEKQIFG